MDFQIRDIRRTVATRMAENLGITPFMIAKVMDHKLPGQAEMAEVYNRYDYLAEKRQALVKWCDHLSRLARVDRPGLRLVRCQEARAEGRGRPRARLGDFVKACRFAFAKADPVAEPAKA